jgi:hypothetical protein
MSTTTVTYDYVYFAGGPGRTRQPRSSTGPGGFTLISSLSGGTLQTGDTFAAGAPPATAIVSGATYSFAFMSVSGGTPAGHTTPSGVNSFNSITPPPPVTVGSTPIVVLVVYVPPLGGGPGGGGSGASIDSFDEATGGLFNDTFVSVSPDPGGLLTRSGNVNGYVDTTNANETITALSPTSPTGVDFDRWVNLYPQATGSTIAGAKLTVNKDAWVYALAFYKVPPPLTTCQTELDNWNNLEPKTDVALLLYYREKLSACQGPQYTAAVNEINVILKGLQGPPAPK